MAARVVEAFSEAGRRRFIAQLSATSAALVGGLFGVGSVKTEAHEERLTMVPATLGMEWGVTTYRIRQSGKGTRTERIVAHLLAPRHEAVGEFVRTRTYRPDNVPYTKTEDGVVEHYTMTKMPLHKEEIQLAWSNETLEIETDHFKGTFGLKYNGRHIGWATVSKDSQSATPEIMDVLSNRSELFSVAAAIGQDLDRAFPRPPRESETCCCDIGCGGSGVSGWGYALTSAIGCESAYESCHTSCWNSYCTGCCELRGCSCACLQGPYISTQFLCTCIAFGNACSCARHCYQ